MPAVVSRLGDMASGQTRSTCWNPEPRIGSATISRTMAPTLSTVPMLMRRALCPVPKTLTRATASAMTTATTVRTPGVIGIHSAR